MAKLYCSIKNATTEKFYLNYASDDIYCFTAKEGNVERVSYGSSYEFVESDDVSKELGKTIYDIVKNRQYDRIVLKNNYKRSSSDYHTMTIGFTDSNGKEQIVEMKSWCEDTNQYAASFFSKMAYEMFEYIDNLNLIILIASPNNPISLLKRNNIKHPKNPKNPKK